MSLYYGIRGFLNQKPANQAFTGKRLCRLGYAALKAKIGRSLRRSGANPPISSEAVVVRQRLMMLNR